MALPYTTIQWADNPIVWKNNITRLNAQNMNLISNALTDISDILLGDNNDGLINQSCQVYERVIEINKELSLIDVTLKDVKLDLNTVKSDLNHKVDSVNGKRGTVILTGNDILLRDNEGTISSYADEVDAKFQKFNEDLDNKADTETGACDLVVTSSNMFDDYAARTVLLDWDSSNNYYTNGTATVGETLNVTGTNRVRIMGSYNNDCTGSAGFTFDIYGSGTVRLEVTDNNGTSYTGSNIVLSSSTTTVSFYFEDHGFTNLDNLEINLQMVAADEAYDVTVSNIMLCRRVRQQHVTGTYTIIANKVEVSFKLDNIVNPGVFTVAGLPHPYPSKDRVFTCSGCVLMSDGVPVGIKPSLCYMYENSDRAVVYCSAVEQSMPFTLTYEI